MKNKKSQLFLTIIMAIIFSTFMTMAYAETNSFTFTVNPTEATVEAGDTVTVDLGIADIDQNSDGINSIQGDLSYDESIFEKVEISTSENNWTVTLNQLNESSRKGRFAIANIGSVKNTQKVAQLKATVKSTTQATSGIIYLNNVTSSYGTAETQSSAVNKTITVKINKKINSGTNDNITGGIINQGTVSGSSKLPQTGVSDWIIIATLIASCTAIIGYIRYKRIDK